MSNPKQPGWRMLEPGIYTDKDLAMHIITDEFLLANGYAATPENEKLVIEMFRKQLQEHGTIIHEV